jgi:hypothetical protein
MDPENYSTLHAARTWRRAAHQPSSAGVIEKAALS